MKYILKTDNNYIISDPYESKQYVFRSVIFDNEQPFIANLRYIRYLANNINKRLANCTRSFSIQIIPYEIFITNKT